MPKRLARTAKLSESPSLAAATASGTGTTARGDRNVAGPAHCTIVGQSYVQIPSLGGLVAVQVAETIRRRARASAVSPGRTNRPFHAGKAYVPVVGLVT